MTEPLTTSADNLTTALVGLGILQDEVRAINVANGWVKDGEPTPEYHVTMLALIASEVFEAIEDIRNGCAPETQYFKTEQAEYDMGALNEDGTLRKPTGVPSEVADILIRLLDYCAIAGIDIVEAVGRKLDHNRTRGYRHGGKTV